MKIIATKAQRHQGFIFNKTFCVTLCLRVFVAIFMVAKRELLTFYEFLVFKYLKNKDVSKNADDVENKSLENFYRFKQLRNRINPRVDKSIDIDKLSNEVNRDIF